MTIDPNDLRTRLATLGRRALASQDGEAVRLAIAEIDRMSHSHHEVREAYHERILDLETEIARLKAELAEAIDQIEIVKENELAVDRREAKESDDLRDTCGHLRGVIEGMREEMADKDKKIEWLKKERGVYVELYHEADQKLVALRGELATANCELEKYRREKRDGYRQLVRNLASGRVHIKREKGDGK